MSDVFAQLEQEVDASKFGTVNSDSTSRLSDLIRKRLAVDVEIENTERYLKDLKYKASKISTEDIPMLMEEMGVESLEVDGHKIKVSPFVHARIADDKKEEAFAFLRSIGEGDIIKNEVTVGFSSGQDNVAGSFVEDLRSQGMDPAQKTYVHPSTLRAWVKNRVTSGKNLDFDTFGVYMGNEAKITRR